MEDLYVNGDRMKTSAKRLLYAMAFFAVLGIEIFIGLRVRDNFVRPYVGDVLVVILIYFFVRIFLPNGLRLLPLYIFLFASAVEALQYINVVRILGIQDNVFLATVIGASFSWPDILCYAVGCGAAAVIDIPKKDIAKSETHP
jgi:hypothetical protein